MSPVTRISHFEKEFNMRTVRRRRDLRGRTFMDCVVLAIERKTNTIYRLCYIETLPTYRNCGYATIGMRWLCRLADKYGIQLELCPLAMEEAGPNVLQLTYWYQSFGFNRIGLDDEMIRYPKRQFVERRKAYAAAN